MPAMTVLNLTGPLPVSAQFVAPADGPVAMFVSGSAWTRTGGKAIGAMLSVDGATQGVCPGYCNEASSHHTLIPVMLTMNLSYGTSGAHTVSLTASTPDTVSDINDFYQVTLLY